jgi:hypothetical protein
VFNVSGEALASLTTYIGVTAGFDISVVIAFPITFSEPVENAPPERVIAVAFVFPVALINLNVYVELDERLDIAIVHGPVPVFV